VLHPKPSILGRWGWAWGPACSSMRRGKRCCEASVLQCGVCIYIYIYIYIYPPETLSPRQVGLGEGASLLIHEATFENGLEADARSALSQTLRWRKKRIANKEMGLLMYKWLFPIRFVRFPWQIDMLFGYHLDDCFKNASNSGFQGPRLAHRPLAPRRATALARRSGSASSATARGCRDPGEDRRSSPWARAARPRSGDGGGAAPVTRTAVAPLAPGQRARMRVACLPCWLPGRKM